MEWITIDHFLGVLKAHDFEIREDGEFIVIVYGDDDRTPYKPRSDGRVPPKTFRRFAYKYGIDIKEFLPPRFMK